MDPEELRRRLEGAFEHRLQTEEHRSGAGSWMELLTGDWEGFDMKSACLQPKFQPAGPLRSRGTGAWPPGSCQPPRGLWKP
jgi:hypothetical protein